MPQLYDILNDQQHNHFYFPELATLATIFNHDICCRRCVFTSKSKPLKHIYLLLVNSFKQPKRVTHPTASRLQLLR
jgi:hypothetical protein